PARSAAPAGRPGRLCLGAVAMSRKDRDRGLGAAALSALVVALCPTSGWAHGPMEAPAPSDSGSGGSAPRNPAESEQLRQGADQGARSGEDTSGSTDRGDVNPGPSRDHNSQLEPIGQDYAKDQANSSDQNRGSTSRSDCSAIEKQLDDLSDAIDSYDREQQWGSDYESDSSTALASSFVKKVNAMSDKELDKHIAAVRELLNKGAGTPAG